jgi:hypothetical protein
MQSQWMSLLHVISDVMLGLGVAVALQPLVIPLFGLFACWMESLAMRAALMVVPLARSLTLGDPVQPNSAWKRWS